MAKFTVETRQDQKLYVNSTSQLPNYMRPNSIFHRHYSPTSFPSHSVCTCVINANYLFCFRWVLTSFTFTVIRVRGRIEVCRKISVTRPRYDVAIQYGVCKANPYVPDVYTGCRKYLEYYWISNISIRKLAYTWFKMHSILYRVVFLICDFERLTDHPIHSNDLDRRKHNMCTHLGTRPDII